MNSFNPIKLFRHEITSALNLLALPVLTCKPILVCGNGGSAADADHIVAELVGGFRKRDREPIFAISLSSNGALLTALLNDYGSEALFRRQVQAYGQKGSVLIALSTSGESMNIIYAVEEANRLDIPVIALTNANKDNTLSKLALVKFNVPSTDTPEVQQMHQVIYHLLCEEMEKMIGGDDVTPKGNTPL